MITKVLNTILTFAEERPFLVPTYSGISTDVASPGRYDPDVSLEMSAVSSRETIHPPYHNQSKENASAFPDLLFNVVHPQPDLSS
jgi:hypothetical protein